MGRFAKAAAVLAVLVNLPLLHRGLPLGWDELEFFRATKWVAEGRVPFRDFWEHHTPLQWLLFAPVARFNGRWIAYGTLMSAAVLANMRLAPLVVITSAVMLSWRDGRWRWNAPALRMLIDWFLPVGIRQLAAAGSIRPYDIAARPPAAIIVPARWVQVRAAPGGSARVRWSVDGSPVNGTTVALQKVARVTVASEERRPVGVLLVPSGVAVLCAAPREEFQF